jgi:hypothetical protein
LGDLQKMNELMIFIVETTSLWFSTGKMCRTGASRRDAANFAPHATSNYMATGHHAIFKTEAVLALEI